MSHKVTIEVELKDKEAIVNACKRLSWKYEAGGIASFYDGTTEQGTVVHVPGWSYPAVIKEDGSIATDTYNGNWGDINDLDKLKQMYAVEQAKATLSKQGLYGQEQQNEDGSLTLTVELYP